MLTIIVFEYLVHCMFLHLFNTCVIRSKKFAPIKTTFRFQGSEFLRNNTFFDEDLHVFNVDQGHVKQSIKTFIDLYSLRTRKSREFWLVDISSLTDANFPKSQLMNQIKSDFRDLSLDLDDDLYLISGMLLNP